MNLKIYYIIDKMSIIRISKTKIIKKFHNYCRDDIYEFDNKIAKNKKGRKQIMPIQINKFMFALNCDGIEEYGTWDMVYIFSIHIILKKIENTNNYILQVNYYDDIYNNLSCPCCARTDEEKKLRNKRKNTYKLIKCIYTIFDINNNDIHKQLYKDIRNYNIKKGHHNEFKYYFGNKDNLLEFEFDEGYDEDSENELELDEDSENELELDEDSENN